MAGIFALFVSLSFIYTLYLQIFSMDSKKAALFAKALSFAPLAGALCLAVSLVIYYVQINGIDNAELKAAIGDALAVYTLPAFITAGIAIFFTVAAYFTGKRTAVVVPSACHLASLLILLFTIICAAWSHYEEFALNVYVNLIGTSLSIMVMPGAALTLRRLSKNLLDKNYVHSRLHKNDHKIKKAEERKKERKRIKETKNRILNNTKK